MPFVLCLAISALPLSLLLAWSRFYPVTEIAALAPTVAALLVALAAYRLVRARRRALAAAALVSNSRLHPFLAGRLGSAVAAGALAALPLPAIAYFTLTASVASWLAITALAALSSLLSVLGQQALAGDVAAAFRPGLLVPAVAALGAAPIAAGHAWVDYALLPLPLWIDEPGPAAMLAAALAELPQRGGGVSDLLAAVRGLEVAAYWLLKLDGAHSMSLVVFITVRDALVFFGLASWLACLQALALGARKDRGTPRER